MAEYAFFTPVDGEDDLVVPTPAAASLWAPGTLHGPAICSLAAMRVETAFAPDEFAPDGLASDGFRPARFTIDLFKAARDVPTSTRTRLIRAGRRIRVAEVDVVQFPSGDDEGVVVARSTTVMLAVSSSNPPGERWSRPADPVTQHLPEVGAGDVFPRFSSDIPDGRTESGAPIWTTDTADQQNAGRSRVWTQAGTPVVGRQLSPFVRAVVSAESTSLVANCGTTGIGFINCDLTVTLARLPVGPRVCVEADSHVEFDGISSSTANLYDSTGMFGTGMVTAVNNSASLIDFGAVDTSNRYPEA